MKRRWNVLLHAGFLLAIAAFASYFYFLRFPRMRDFPWVNLLLFAVALVLLVMGLARAYGKPREYRGMITGPILAALSAATLALFLFMTFHLTRQLPASTGAPRVGRLGSGSPCRASGGASSRPTPTGCREALVGTYCGSMPAW